MKPHIKSGSKTHHSFINLQSFRSLLQQRAHCKPFNFQPNIQVEEEEMEDLWQKMVFPVRRVWGAVSARVKPRKDG